MTRSHMTRSHVTLTAALMACLALSACSTDHAPGATATPTSVTAKPSGGAKGEPQPFKDDSDVPLTEQFRQSDLTRAVPDAGDILPGYYPGSLHKSMPGEADDCAPRKGPASPGWQRSVSGDYDYQGSTISRGIDVDVCQFDTVAHAKAAYALWPDREETAPPSEAPTPVGEESLFLVHTGSSGIVWGYTRSGTVIARVEVEDAAGDPTDARHVLAATIKRLQQVQAGRPPTATAVEIADLDRARRR
ncbi:hypothetical protein [Streptomyces sp. NPDC126499]|uniref:hypothetical protein n=1 Tax=Streptomyces sp. NPDC126499 TaxID=3155314 RepID=UPI00331903A6